jgi:exodeoxyribonuclease VII large subunit
MLTPAAGPHWLSSARSVSALTWALKRHVESEFRGVTVIGEVSGEKLAQGHLYFQLKDAEAQIPCVIWRSHLARIKTAIRTGQHLAVRGNIEVYPPHGRYQLIVTDAHDIGRGALHAELAALTERLAAEGLFAAARKRPLPFLPRRIGLVTAPNGAAVRDVMRTLLDRFPVDVLLSPARVQGDGAGAELAAALNRVARAPGVDVVILTRGGGSVEDLSAFNDEGLVRAIAASPVPVVSAVGHEHDSVLSDLVADLRTATPTAAANVVIPFYSNLIETLDAATERLELATARRLAEASHRLAPVITRLAPAAERRFTRDTTRLERLEHRLDRARPEMRLAAWRQRLERLSERLAKAGTVRRDAVERRLARAEERLRLLSPLASLDRGYAIVRKEDGSVVLGPDAVSTTETLEIIVRDGRFRARRSDSRETPS